MLRARSRSAALASVGGLPQNSWISTCRMPHERAELSAVSRSRLTSSVQTPKLARSVSVTGQPHWLAQAGGFVGGHHDALRLQRVRVIREYPTGIAGLDRV